MSIIEDIRTFLKSKLEVRHEWSPYEKITDMQPTQIDNVYYSQASVYVFEIQIMLLRLGNSEECTPTLQSQFARIYSLPTHKYNSANDNFRKYFKWLENRNKHIIGFTKYEDNYYMVAYRKFYYY